MTWEQMQAGELDWWRAFLARPNALPRLFGLYGYRYLSYFFEEFDRLGAVIDFGSGPVSAAWIADLPPAIVVCVDPLFGAYRDAGLVYGEAVVPAGDLTPVFDTALVLNVLDHADDPAGLLMAVAASLKPGGKALVWVHVDAEPDALHRRVADREVAKWIADAGLSIVRDCRRGRGHGGPDEYLAVATR
jgi:SAM-dependent methyltransferase